MACFAILSANINDPVSGVAQSINVLGMNGGNKVLD